jgi:hypothetical protein
VRIAIVSEVFLPAVDGVVTRLCRTLEEQQRLGDEVMVCAPAGGPPSYAGAPVVSVPAVRLPFYPDGRGYPRKRVSLPQPVLGKALRLFGPDVIHAVNPVLLGAAATYYARSMGIPLVSSYHANLPLCAHYYGLGFLERPGWSYLRALHNRAAVNLCTSQATLQMLRGRGFERLRLWPYGLDTERFHPRHRSTAWRERLSAGQPERVIALYVGRLAKEKAIERLLPMARSLAGVSLAIVGDGPLRGELERRFAGTPTTFLGLLEGSDLAAAFASAERRSRAVRDWCSRHDRRRAPAPATGRRQLARRRRRAADARRRVGQPLRWRPASAALADMSAGARVRDRHVATTSPGDPLHGATRPRPDGQLRHPFAVLGPLGEPVRAWIVARRLGHPKAKLALVAGTIFAQTLLNLMALTLLAVIALTSTTIARGGDAAILFVALGPGQSCCCSLLAHGSSSA